MNSWAGTGAAGIEGRFGVLRAVLSGAIDATTGYLCDIKAIDELLRRTALPCLGVDGVRWMSGMVEAFAATARRCPGGLTVERLSLLATPFTSLHVGREEPRVVELTQTFEFSAAHRLWCRELSPQQNAALFGKCSNPNGHGHNYVLEVTLAGTPDERSGRFVDLPALDRLVRQRVIEPFDHKNLNVECAEFSELNPTVENIARVIWGELRDAVAPARLTRVRVWETPKTYAECTSDE